jgi:hypothetical protein
MKKFNARLLGAITRNFEYSKIRQKIRVSSTRWMLDHGITNTNTVLNVTKFHQFY